MFLIELDPHSRESKYLQIVHAIRDALSSGALRPDQQLPGELELQENLGVSRSTIRKALETLENRGFIYRRQGLGTFVGTAPGTSVPGLPSPTFGSASLPETRGTLGVLVPSLSNELYGQIIRGIEGVAEGQRWQVFSANTHADRNRELNLVRTMVDRGISGLILDPAHGALDAPGSPNWEVLHELQIPLVLLNNNLPDVQAARIMVDDRQGGAMAARHLADLGHRHIGMIYQDSVLAGLERHEGLIQGLAARGITLDKNLVRTIKADQPPPEATYRHTQDLMRRTQPPSALVYFNDELAQTGIRALRDLGIRVPQQVSVLGFDNIPSSATSHPSLSTLDNAALQCGRWAADLLFEQVRAGSRDFARALLISPVLVARESTAAFPGGR